MTKAAVRVQRARNRQVVDYGNIQQSSGPLTQVMR